MFRHQEGDPGRGEESSEQHDQGVDSADTPPQHQVATPATHLVSLSGLASSCLHQTTELSSGQTCSHRGSFCDTDRLGLD